LIQQKKQAEVGALYTASDRYRRGFIQFVRDPSQPIESSVSIPVGAVNGEQVEAEFSADIRYRMDAGNTVTKTAAFHATFRHAAGSWKLSAIRLRQAFPP
jgi:hypothetical protein